jgi:hypothetical protein
LLGQTRTNTPIMGAAADLIMSRPPSWDVPGGGIDLGYWYHASHAMFQVGGPQWRKWQRSVHAALLPNQRKDGNFAGSWDPVSVRAHHGGRVYTTAMALLTLQAEYRYGSIEKLTILPDDKLFTRANASWIKRQYGKFAQCLKIARNDKMITVEQRQAIVKAESSLASLVAAATTELEGFDVPLVSVTQRSRAAQISKMFRSLPVGKLARKLLKQKHP